MDKTGFDIILSEAEIQELQNAVVSPAQTHSRSKKHFVIHKKSGAITGVSSLLTENETDNENIGAGAAKAQLRWTYEDEVDR